MRVGRVTADDLTDCIVAASIVVSACLWLGGSFGLHFAAWWVR